MQKAKLAILASGRGSNAVALIQASKSADFPAEVALVLSDNRDAPVLKKAEELGVKALYLDPGPKRSYLIPEVEASWIQALQENDVDYVLLAGFMRLLKRTFLEAFPLRVLNIHPALLPSFRGLDAQQQAWEYGVRYSGATVHFVDSSLDAGPIILQEPVKVLPDDTPQSLADRILEAEHRIYPEAVRLLCQGRLRIEGRRVKILREWNSKEAHGK
ncbi:phosphoribosylglycinamide formyltransferase [candidate division WOR-3 bacterium]|nr:phosphoribosylglycinamide formyltransferase [candidate division WOR-3 bacterium]